MFECGDIVLKILLIILAAALIIFGLSFLLGFLSIVLNFLLAIFVFILTAIKSIFAIGFSKLFSTVGLVVIAAIIIAIYLIKK